jgi:lysozyme
MEISSKGVALIKEFESFRKTPYLCAAGVPTIGWGTTRYPDKKAVKLSDPKITEAVGDMYLHHDLTTFEKAVTKALTIPIQQCQFDACISLCYNIGQGNFTSSTLVKMLNAGTAPDLIAPQFLRWDKAKGKSLAGLTRRRKAEMTLFLTSTA